MHMFISTSESIQIPIQISHHARITIEARTVYMLTTLLRQTLAEGSRVPNPLNQLLVRLKCRNSFLPTVTATLQYTPGALNYHNEPRVNQESAIKMSIHDRM